MGKKSYLKSFVKDRAVSIEAFLKIREIFSQSLASLSICSYILGIGDRHLENFLIDTRRGELIPIDFGHSFGSATELLPVPELVPFRLTPQLEYFLSPLGTRIMLHYPMTQVLSALKNEKDELVAALDIFVNEPLIEWQQRASKQGSKQGSKRRGEEEDDKIDWYPNQKLEIVKRKLKGENPIYILQDELKLNHHAADFVKNIKEYLMDREFTDVLCKDVSTHVDSLIDLATDENILGRSWIGWSPWC